MRRACCASTFLSSMSAGLLERLLDRALGDLVEDHAAAPSCSRARPAPRTGASRSPRPRGRGRRPGRSPRRVLGRGLQLVEHLLARGQHLVLGGEALLDVDAQLLLGQVADVAHRGLHLEVLPRYLLIVFALAGDSTITRFFGHVSPSVPQRRVRRAAGAPCLPSPAPSSSASTSCSGRPLRAQDLFHARAARRGVSAPSDRIGGRRRPDARRSVTPSSSATSAASRTSTRAVPDQGVGRRRAGLARMARHRHHLASLLERAARRHQRPARSGGLDHDHGPSPARR